MRRSYFPISILLCLVLTGMVGRPESSRAEGAAAYQSLNWDQAMTLPPGAYRANKAIDLNGDFTVTTKANTQIEGVHFHGRSGVQHWHVEGTLLRQVWITGKRNASGHGIDSAFEDVSFDKDDNWYNFWWSTRWRFDNCIFTKRFLRGDLPPLDYSAHASHCTFYGVKLPPVGFKENPAGYMGKDEMVFEHCRFVDCDVPETFLACTADCVFERCRFEPKHRVAWPKETTPFIITAYYAGDTEPGSYVNGPFSVKFQSEPLSGGRGSTVPHTQSGGRITLTNLRLNGPMAAMGTSLLKASQFATAEVVLSPFPSVAPVSLAVPPQPGVPVPGGALLDGSTPAAFIGKWRVIVLDRAYSAERTMGADHVVTENGQRVGTWEIKDNHFLMHVDLRSGLDTYDLPARDGSMRGTNLIGWSVSLTREDAPVAPSVRTQVVGTWDRSDLTLNVQTVISFTPEGIYTYDGKAQGRWRVYGDSVLVTYDKHPEWTDLFELPGADGALTGINNSKNRLKLVRHQGAIPLVTPGATPRPTSYFGAK